LQIPENERNWVRIGRGIPHPIRIINKSTFNKINYLEALNESGLRHQPHFFIKRFQVVTDIAFFLQNLAK